MTSLIARIERLRQRTKGGIPLDTDGNYMLDDVIGVVKAWEEEKQPKPKPYKKEPWMNSKAYCWFCKKDVDCECCDATCWICGRPYAKDRCKEFGFDADGNKINKPADPTYCGGEGK